MTISDKQLEANRKNAKLGGVKTEEGKAVSRLNALKHGLLSEVILLPEEDDNALLELGKRMRAELKPVGELELSLVDRITSNLWRLRRALKVEKEMMYEDCHPKISFPALDGEDGKNLGEALSYDFANYDTYGKLIRYEASIERGFYKALHELQRLQAIRNGQTVPAPLAVDVSFPTI
jgi:hypothetical protein